MIVTIPFRLSSPGNGSQKDWRTKAKQRATQRRVVAAVLRERQPLPSTPVVVTLTRVGPRPLDDDNLAASFKSVRDEVASALGCGDSLKDPIKWVYEQRRGEPKKYAVEIKIEAFRGDE